MIHDFKPYPVYKDSGVPWLGEVPEHWDIRRLKNTSTLHGRIGFHGLSSSDYGSNGIIVVSGSNFLNWYVDWNRCHRISEDWYEKDKNIQLRNGDLLVTKDGTIGKTAIVSELTERAVLNSGVIVVRPRIPTQYENRYLLYLINSKVFDTFIDIKRTGATISHLYEATFNNFSIFLPPLSEQSTIVKFLDHANQRIRRYIRAKQKLIKLLEEQKQAIIHQTVTIGLDPNIKLKPSGVEWIGKVPEHWDVLRVKQISKILRGKFTHRPRNDPAFYDGPYPFIQTGEVARSVKVITSFKQTLNERGLAISKMFPRGTLVMTIAANIGDVAVLDFEACFPDSVVGFVPHSFVERDFLYYVFCAMKPELLCEAPVNTQGNLNVDRIGSRAIGLPPLTEQQEIVRFVEELTSELEQVMEIAKSEISLFREYRTRLIADVVTGKLDVREAVANLPEEIDETEVLDEGLVEDEETTEEDLDREPEEET